MSDMNKVMLSGRLTRDPQLRYLQNQTAVCDFGFASGRKFKVNGEQREETAFVDCTLFGKGGEIINQYCQKGSQLIIEGRLKLDQWDDKTTGQKRSKLTVVVEEFHMIGGKAKDGQGGERSDDYKPVASRSPSRSGGYGASRETVPPADDIDPPHDDSDLPF